MRLRLDASPFASRDTAGAENLQRGSGGRSRQDGGPEVGRQPILRHVAGRARSAGPVDVVGRVGAGDDHDARRGKRLPDPPGGLDPVHDRHVQIHEEEIREKLAGQPRRLAAVVRHADHVEAVQLERRGQRLQEKRLVVGYEDTERAPGPEGRGGSHVDREAEISRKLAPEQEVPPFGGAQGSGSTGGSASTIASTSSGWSFVISPTSGRGRPVSSTTPSTVPDTVSTTSSTVFVVVPTTSPTGAVTVFAGASGSGDFSTGPGARGGSGVASALGDSWRLLPFGRDVAFRSSARRAGSGRETGTSGLAAGGAGRTGGGTAGEAGRGSSPGASAGPTTSEAVTATTPAATLTAEAPPRSDFATVASPPRSKTPARRRRGPSLSSPRISASERRARKMSVSTAARLSPISSAISRYGRPRHSRSRIARRCCSGIRARAASRPTSVPPASSSRAGTSARSCGSLKTSSRRRRPLVRYPAKQTFLAIVRSQFASATGTTPRRRPRSAWRKAVCAASSASSRFPSL